MHPTTSNAFAISTKFSECLRVFRGQTAPFQKLRVREGFRHEHSLSGTVSLEKLARLGVQFDLVCNYNKSLPFPPGVSHEPRCFPP